MVFPPSFTERLRRDLGEDRAENLIKVMQQPSPTTVRINPLKISDPRSQLRLPLKKALEVSRYGYLLGERPVFTTDPLFQCGCYYVQEASSMVLERVIASGNIIPSEPSGGLKVLDLCAAPGGKSTHLLSLLREIPGSFLVSNEVIGQRAGVLADNISRWGHSNVLVTNDDPSDFKSLPGYFDIILIDAPCSGEGMFRKDPKAVAEWSGENVRLCAARQRRIIADAIPALRPGGALIYSTCTLNTVENEENVSWTARQYGMEILSQEHLYPGDEYGEGLFIAALRAPEKERDRTAKKAGKPELQGRMKEYRDPVQFIRDGYVLYMKDRLLKAYPASCAGDMLYAESRLKTIRSGCAAATAVCDRRGCVTLIPEPDLAFSEVLRRSTPESSSDGLFPEKALTYEEALKYMKCEPPAPGDAPKGFILITYSGHPLGFAKNIGTRTNSLWPSVRKIRM